MRPEGKRLTWTRWAVRITAQDPATTLAAVQFHGLDSDRFQITGSGVVGNELRLVIEYTARGANSDDVKRRFTSIGIDRSRITVQPGASIDLEFSFNCDVAGAIGRGLVST